MSNVNIIVDDLQLSANKVEFNILKCNLIQAKVEQSIFHFQYF